MAKRLITPDGLWTPPHARSERPRKAFAMPRAVGGISPRFLNRRCCCGEEPCACTGWPDEWVADLGAGNWTNELCDFCDQMFGEFVLTSLFPLDPLLCSAIHTVTSACTWSPDRIGSLLLSLATEATTGDSRRYVLNVIIANQFLGLERRAIFKSSEWDWVINPSCFFLADENGDITLTKTTEGNSLDTPNVCEPDPGDFPSGSGSTLPATVTISNANP